MPFNLELGCITNEQGLSRLVLFYSLCFLWNIFLFRQCMFISIILSLSQFHHSHTIHSMHHFNLHTHRIQSVKVREMPTNRPERTQLSNRQKRKNFTLISHCDGVKAKICNTKKTQYLHKRHHLDLDKDCWNVKENVNETESERRKFTQLLTQKLPTDTKRVITAKLYRSRQFCIFKWRVLESSSIISLIIFFLCVLLIPVSFFKFLLLYRNSNDLCKHNEWDAPSTFSHQTFISFHSVDVNVDAAISSYHLFFSLSRKLN